MVCKCGSDNIIYDNARGDSVCINCGNVMEENAVVSDIAFENTKVLGTFVGDHASSCK